MIEGTERRFVKKDEKDNMDGKANVKSDMATLSQL